MSMTHGRQPAATGPKAGAVGGSDGVVEAAVPGMSQDEREVGHDNSEGARPSHPPAGAIPLHLLG